MDQLLSPGFSIPSIGTPLHQPEEDQQILPNAMHQQQQMPPLAPVNNSMSPFGLGMPHLNPPKMHTYAPVPSFSTPQSMMHPQTPVRYP